MLILFFVCGFSFGLCCGSVIAYKFVKKSMCNQLDRTAKIADKNLAIINLFSMWIQNKENGLKIQDYLVQRNIKKIAIYGMSFVGERLYDELENSDIEVVYCIDKNCNNLYKDILVYNPDDNFEVEVDAVIVTAFTFFDEIEKKLKAKLDVPIISVDDIIYSL